MEKVLASDELLERIKKVVIEVLRVKPEEIGNDSRFIEDLGADSLDVVTLLMALEDEFKESISDEDARTLTTVRATMEYISARLGEGNQAS
jgi:acyl carrier protein